MKNAIRNPRVFGLLFLAIVMIFVFSGFNKNKVTDDKTTVAKVTSVQEVVSSSGSVVAGGVTEVYSPTKGVIKKVLIEDGETVKKDQPLVEVTSTATEAEKAEALSDLYVARVALKKAENDRNNLQYSLEVARKAILDVENTKKIFDENILAQKPNSTTGRAYTEEEKLGMASTVESTRKSFSNLEKQYLDATDTIRSAQVALAEANVAYKATMDTVVKSPVAGVVSNLKKMTGNTVDTEKALLVVKSSPDLMIEINVSEFNISKIKKDLVASVTFDALPGLSVPARVLGFDMVGNEKLGTVSYGVTVILEPSASEIDLIRPAMTANVVITTNKVDGVLAIPRSAIKLENGKYFVMLAEEKGPSKKEVGVGLLGTDTVEVKSGIRENDKVLTVFEDKDEK